MDGDKKPTMSFLYEVMRLMKDIVADATYKSSKAYLKIIDERWCNMFLHAGKHFNMYIHVFYHYV